MSGLDAFDEYLDRVKGAVLQIPFIKNSEFIRKFRLDLKRQLCSWKSATGHRVTNRFQAQFSQSSCRVICICCVNLQLISTDLNRRMQRSI